MGQQFWQNSKWTSHKGKEGRVLYQEVRSLKGKAGLDSPGRILKQTLSARLGWKGGKEMKDGGKGGRQGED